ncbi:PDR/VanB family oxidoreductase [Amycolatopsis sp. NPDC051903]|uniref:PDR/VanB family oxidoreductase n=1 Tax=Amycolatopsis sp. NPDC051903 TaxID=3363936 RepID=UPI0037B5DADC
MHEDDIAVVVKERQQVTENVVRLVLGRADGAALPSWTPGAHIDLVLDDGTIRQYSLCGSTGSPDWTVMVLREAHGRGGSRRIHDDVKDGTVLGARGPRNHFPLTPAPRYRFLAGGIGITPILPMLAEAEDRGAQWSLTYCGRSHASLALADELVTRYGPRVRVHRDDTDGLPDVDTLFADPAPGEIAYVCGPAGLLDAVLARTGHWATGTVHFERFTPAEAAFAEGTEFEVELAGDGAVLTVPADRSLLDVLTEHGYQVLSSCTEGTCGSCETPVLSGAVDHRDAVLSAEEREAGDVMMVCVSRAACPRLVLDL